MMKVGCGFPFRADLRKRQLDSPSFRLSLALRRGQGSPLGTRAIRLGLLEFDVFALKSTSHYAPSYRISVLERTVNSRICEGKQLMSSAISFVRNAGEKRSKV